ncbi:hypothetical protein SI65_06201 [Aspergillus cristatus]|uniref:Ubiquitin carboxyl-terminal hydrolase n=1 Tax=Aspergillus cristatus TaxID=573508 RepID=A0A1E3BBI6_ASPCR|nr:hypothetical protein SI65_06201 [Aspergillus cristatus]
MSGRARRRRLSTQSGEEDSDEPSQPIELKPDEWNGFCEIESEPAFFNVMLREFGVKGVKVQEVVSLEEELLAFLNKPVYGLIFLFRWREDDPEKQEPSCPEGIWFANQTASNACASVALLNIVNNIEGIELGENLQQFKDFTMSFTPALRGDAVNNFEFVKRIHNSFARNMDLRNADLQLKNEATSRRRTKSTRDDEADAGFHFIAFVPAMGKVWKFDGLERQPQSIGDCLENDWLDLVRPNILTRMEEYEEDQIEFSILSLGRDPLLGLTEKLAVNVKSLELVNKRLGGTTNSETAAANGEDNTILGPDASLSLTREAIDHAEIPANQKEAYESCSPEELNQFHQKLSEEQQDLRAAIRLERESEHADDDYAAGRRYNYQGYGPAVAKWLRFLARKEYLEDQLE